MKGEAMLQDFKAFVMRGNVLDMAVGIVIGAAFGKIVSSFVNGILMPPIGLLLGGVDFANLFVNLGDQPFASLAAATEAGAPVIAYGQFINVVLDFLIVAFAIFLVVRAVASLQKEEEEKPATEHDCPECLSAIPIQARRCKFCTAAIPAA
jgi:large conductance mechanosensitive channel